MIINKIETNQISKTGIVKRIKDFFLPKKTIMQNIEKDVFEKTVSDGAEKMSEKKLRMPRRLPNCVSGPNEYDHIIPGQGGYVRYYPEDIEKMKSMNKEEIFNFKKELRQQNRYYFEQ